MNGHVAAKSERDKAEGQLERRTLTPRADGIDLHSALRTLQHAAGNRAVTELMQFRDLDRSRVDRYEREANRVAETVVNADDVTSPTAVALTAPPTPERASGDGPSNDTGTGAAAVKRARRGTRVTLPHKSAVESDFDQPLDHVEAYVGPDAERACDALGAEAFTFGNTICFRASHPDIRTVRHEVAHVIQQGGTDGGHATPSPARVTTLSPDSEAERAARSGEGAGAQAAMATTTTQSPTLALKLRKKATATTNQVVHLLKALGGAKLATLPQDTLVAVVEVLADGRAFGVYVPQLDLTGILPRHTLTELPHLEHIGGREFKNLRQPEGKPQSLEELAQQDPSLRFLAWSPAKEARKAEEAEGAKTAERRAAVQSMTLPEIKRDWDKRGDDLLAVASDPTNELNGDQMYAIWLSYWMREQGAAHEAFRKAEERVRAEIGNGEFAIRMHDFKKGKRDIYGPDYETAANRKDAVDFMLMRLIGVRNWLEQYVDVMGKRVTLDEVNAKAYEIVKAHQDFQTYFAPVIYGLIGYGATLGAGTQPGSRPAPPQPRGASKPGEATKPPAGTPAAPGARARPIAGRFRNRVASATMRIGTALEEAGLRPSGAAGGETGKPVPAVTAPAKTTASTPSPAAVSPAKPQTPATPISPAPPAPSTAKPQAPAKTTAPAPAAPSPAAPAPAATPSVSASKPQGQSAAPSAAAKRKLTNAPATGTAKTYKSHDPGGPEVIYGPSVAGPATKVDPRAAGKLAEGTEPGQTYARTEEPVAPGVTRRSTTAARQSEAARQVRDVSVADIQQHVAAMNKAGVKFKFGSTRLAAHAEVKQIVKRPNQTVYVSQRPCASCIRFFRAEAQFQRRRQTIVDPDRTWMFEPDGSFWTKQH